MVADTAVSGVLDWANAHVGDPRADLARTATILRLAPLPPGTPPLLAQALLRVVERHWRRGYRALAGPIGGMALFYAWAGAVMLADLAPKLGRPGVWLEPRHLEPIRRWTARWRQRAGVPPLV
jgi:aminoglycoside phosphotransferase (APT) family kinase protein